MIAGGAEATLLLTQADSARVGCDGLHRFCCSRRCRCSLSRIAAFFLRRASAEARSLIWRSAIVALLIVFVGRQLPLHWIAWVVPSALAAPLVALGRVQVTGSARRRLSVRRDVDRRIGDHSRTVSRLRGGRRRRCSFQPSSDSREDARVSVARCACTADGGSACSTTRAARSASFALFEFSSTSPPPVPMTWGFVRPVVVLPRVGDVVGRRAAAHRAAARARTRARARLGVQSRRRASSCALYWFHPGVWWVARGLREDCELACDDRVIAAGVRRSDYAELLVSAADRVARRCALPSRPRSRCPSDGGLRARLTAVLDTRHDVRPLRRGWAAVAAVATLPSPAPVSAVQLAPSRDVLTTLMLDARWESRAYAVLGLAQRRDSIAVARSAAELDPNPRVRAWARYALGDAETSPSCARSCATDPPSLS